MGDASSPLSVFIRHEARGFLLFRPRRECDKRHSRETRPGCLAMITSFFKPKTDAADKSAARDDVSPVEPPAGSSTPDGAPKDAAAAAMTETEVQAPGASARVRAPRAAALPTPAPCRIA